MTQQHHPVITSTSSGAPSTKAMKQCVHSRLLPWLLEAFFFFLPFFFLQVEPSPPEGQALERQ